MATKLDSAIWNDVCSQSLPNVQARMAHALDFGPGPYDGRIWDMSLLLLKQSEISPPLTRSCCISGVTNCSWVGLRHNKTASCKVAPIV
jgi:hypothetical protein